MTSLAHKCMGFIIGTRNIKRDFEMVLNLVFSGNSGCKWLIWLLCLSPSHQISNYFSVLLLVLSFAMLFIKLYILVTCKTS